MPKYVFLLLIPYWIWLSYNLLNEATKFFDSRVGK